MIYQEGIVHVVPGKMNDYMEIVSKEIIPIYNRVGIKFIGSWQTIDGGNSLDVVVLFAYENMAQLEKQTELRNADKDWPKVLAKYQTVTNGVTYKLLRPNSYSSLK
jgi:hypothetical protein